MWQHKENNKYIYKIKKLAFIVLLAAGLNLLVIVFGLLKLCVIFAVKNLTQQQSTTRTLYLVGASAAGPLHSPVWQPP